MKKFEMPKIEVVEFPTCDIITTSSTDDLTKNRKKYETQLLGLDFLDGLD